jgi:hypothetical protein
VICLDITLDIGGLHGNRGDGMVVMDQRGIIVMRKRS